MILTPDCLVCAQHVALESARFITQDEVVLKNVVYGMMDVLKDAVPKKVDSFIIALKTMEVIRKATGCSDPYKGFKERATQVASRLAPQMRDTMRRNNDPLRAACYAAVMGNNLDVVGNSSHDLVNERACAELYFAINDFEQLRSVLGSAQKIVYLADNAGEVFFDRIFMEGMLAVRQDAEIDYFIKAFPFLSDAQYEDIVEAHIEEIATVKTLPLIEPIEMDQTYLSRMFEEFLSVAKRADLVVAKGQANFELLPSMMNGAFYLFMHKCPVIAKQEGARVGEAAIYRK
jgi:damage-control phosphatase, subfamily I